MKPTLLVGLLLGLLLPTLPACSSVPQTEKSGEQYAQIAGNNPREIVFVHGMFVTPACWENWETRFKNAGYQVSAPAWPLHEGSIADLRKPERMATLGKLELTQVLDYYRALLKAKPVKPILIGHSMGGLIVQILLAEGLAQAAVAVDSAPPNGVIWLNWSFIKSNWGAINPFANSEQPIELDVDQFSYAFLNQEDPSARQKIYDEFYVPESRRIGKAPTTDAAKINVTRARGPLLIVAGGGDHIIPAKLNYKNFEFYSESPAYTEFKLFEGRDHWTLGASGWQDVAASIDQWLSARFAH